MNLRDFSKRFLPIRELHGQDIHGDVIRRFNEDWRLLEEALHALSSLAKETLESKGFGDNRHSSLLLAVDTSSHFVCKTLKVILFLLHLGKGRREDNTVQIW